MSVPHVIIMRRAHGMIRHSDRVAATSFEPADFKVAATSMHNC